LLLYKINNTKTWNLFPLTELHCQNPNLYLPLSNTQPKLYYPERYHDFRNKLWCYYIRQASRLGTKNNYDLLEYH
jgi:hypothetical protein